MGGALNDLVSRVYNLESSLKSAKGGMPDLSKGQKLLYINGGLSNPYGENVIRTEISNNSTRINFSEDGWIFIMTAQNASNLSPVINVYRGSEQTQVAHTQTKNCVHTNYFVDKSMYANVTGIDDVGTYVLIVFYPLKSIL